MHLNQTGFILNIRYGFQLMKDHLGEESEEYATFKKNFYPLLERAVNVGNCFKTIAETHKLPFAFSRIVEKKVQGGRWLFGSKMKVSQYKEFQLYAAKHNGEEWVPDMERLITRFVMTEEHLASALIDATSCTGYPATIGSILNQEVEQPTSVFINTNQQYTNSIDRKQREIFEHIKEARTLLMDKIESGERLDKAFKEKMKAALGTIHSRLRDDNSFDLEMLLETLQKDSGSIYADVITNINSLLRDIAEEDDVLRIEHKQDVEQTSLLDQILDYYFSKEMSDLVFEFVEEIGAHFQIVDKPQYSSVKPENHVYKLKSWFKHWGYYSEYRNFKKHDALLTISQSRTGNMHFFGDLQNESRMVAMELSWGCAEFRRHSDLNFDKLAPIVEFYYNPVQFLQLMSGTSTGLWVKTTLRSLICQHFEREAFDTQPIADIEIPEIDDVPVAETAANIALDVSALANSNSQSKAKKEDMLALLDQLTELATRACEERRDQFLERGAELQQQVMKKSISEINKSVDNILDRRPDIKLQVENMLSTKNLIENKM